MIDIKEYNFFKINDIYLNILFFLFNAGRKLENIILSSVLLLMRNIVSETSETFIRFEMMTLKTNASK